MMTQFCAVLRKELRESARLFWKQGLVFLGYALFFQWGAVAKWASQAAGAAGGDAGVRGSLQLAGAAPALTLALTPPVVIPLFAQVILNKCLVRDRAGGGLATTLATGIPGGLLWSADVVTAFLCGWPVTLLSMGAGIALVGHPNTALSWSGNLLWIGLVVAPLVALATVSVTALLYWSTKWPDMVVSFFPVLVSFAVFGYCVDNRVPQMAAGALVTISVTMLVLVGICLLLTTRLSRQSAAGY